MNFQVHLIVVSADQSNRAMECLNLNCTPVVGNTWLFEGELWILSSNELKFNHLGEGVVQGLGDLNQKELISLCKKAFGISPVGLKYDPKKGYKKTTRVIFRSENPYPNHKKMEEFLNFDRGRILYDFFSWLKDKDISIVKLTNDELRYTDTGHDSYEHMVADFIGIDYEELKKERKNMFPEVNMRYFGNRFNSLGSLDEIRIS